MADLILHALPLGGAPSARVYSERAEKVRNTPDGVGIMMLGCIQRVRRLCLNEV